MGALGGSWYLNKGTNGELYSSEPGIDPVDMDELEKEIQEILRASALENQHRNNQSRYNYNRRNYSDAIVDDRSYNRNDNITIVEKGTDMVQTIVLKHNGNDKLNIVTNIVSITKRDKTVGITFTKEFLLVIAVNDYIGGDIPIILYARNFNIDALYTRFLSTVGKLAIKGYGSRYFGGRKRELHLTTGQLHKDCVYEAIQLAREIDKIIKKDIVKKEE